MTATFNKIVDQGGVLSIHTHATTGSGHVRRLKTLLGDYEGKITPTFQSDLK